MLKFKKNLIQKKPLTKNFLEFSRQLELYTPKIEAFSKENQFSTQAFFEICVAIGEIQSSLFVQANVKQELKELDESRRKIEEEKEKYIEELRKKGEILSETVLKSYLTRMNEIEQQITRLKMWLKNRFAKTKLSSQEQHNLSFYQQHQEQIDTFWSQLQEKL